MLSVAYMQIPSRKGSLDINSDHADGGNEYAIWSINYEVSAHYEASSHLYSESSCIYAAISLNKTC